MTAGFYPGKHTSPTSAKGRKQTQMGTRAEVRFWLTGQWPVLAQAWR